MTCDATRLWKDFELTVWSDPEHPTPTSEEDK